MLYVAVGTLWVVSIVCILFLTTYVYRLTKRQLSEGNRSYFWTISRVLVALLLGLSAFYFGVASQLESLPKLTIYRLQIREIPVWSAEAWVALSLACAVCGVLFALTDTLKNDFEIHKGLNLRLLRFEHPQIPIKVPYALTVSNHPPESVERDSRSPRYESQAEQFWALANVLVGLFTGCFLFVGLQTVSQLNFVQALGINDNFGNGLAFNERIRPTPTPTATPVVGQGVSANSQPDVAKDAPVDDVAENNQRVALSSEPVVDTTSTTGDSTQAAPAPRTGLNDAAAAVGQSTNNPQTRPSQSDDEQTPLVNTTDLNSIDPDSTDADLAVNESAALPEAETPANNEAGATAASPLVSIREQYGVNARSGPGLGFNVVTILGNGTEHPLVGRSGDGQWFNIQLPDASTGWVASWVVDIIQ